MKEEVSNTIHEIRTGSNLTQEKLSHEVGVSRQTIIAIEKGNYVPSVLLALKFSQFFNKPIEELFYIHK
jgi:putative transcriptional regulator